MVNIQLSKRKYDVMGVESSNRRCRNVVAVGTRVNIERRNNIMAKIGRSSDLRDMIGGLLVWTPLVEGRDS